MDKKTVSVNEMLIIVGSYNCYQWIVNVIFCIMIIPQTFQILIMYFAALSPSWKCIENSTICNSTDLFSNNDNKRCKMNRENWDYTEPKTFSITTQFDLVCENEWLISLSSAIFFAGWIFGALVIGWMADKYGRKFVYFPSTATMIIIGFSTAYSPNILILLIFRFISGFTVPGTNVQAFVLISELVDKKHQVFASQIIFSCFTISLCLLGLKAYFIRQWKLLFIVCTAPYIIVLLFYPLVPESIKWLMVNNKTEKLNKTLEKIARRNNKVIPDNVTLNTGERDKSPKSSFLDLFWSIKQSIYTLVQGYAWMVNGMVYYGLSLAADDLGGNLYLNFVLVSLVEFPSLASAIYFCGRVGRKKTIVISLLLGSLICLAVPLILESGKVKIMRIILGMTGKFFVTVSFDSIFTWSVELYPTTTRGKAMGLFQITARFGAAASPFITKGLKVIHKSTPFIIMGLLGLIGVALQLVLPETKEQAQVEPSDIELKQNMSKENNVTP